MATGAQLFSMIRSLITQTELGNVRWDEIEPYVHRFVGSGSAAQIESVDRDGDFPLRFSVLNSDGSRFKSWITDFRTSGDGGRQWDDQVRKLWHLVSQKDPVVTLLEDLENLPPF